MKVPSRFLFYFFMLGCVLTTLSTVAVYEYRADKYVIDKGNGINVSMDEFVEEVQFIKDISNNFSIPYPIFDNIVGIDIITYNGESVEYLNRTYYVNNKFEGISMLPTMYAGNTLLCIKDFTKEELQINSIIVFKRNNGYVSHRIIDIQNGSYITKGDNNMVTDRPVEYEDVHCLVGGVLY